MTLAVAGGGRQGSFRRLARRLKVAERVALLGPVLDPVPLLWGATCALHPSRYDPCSLVVLEALACGLPVVASAADGAADLVSAPAGVVVEGDAPRPWAEALEQVQEDWADRSAAAAAARRTWDDVASDLLGLLELAPARRVP